MSCFFFSSSSDFSDFFDDEKGYAFTDYIGAILVIDLELLDFEWIEEAFYFLILIRGMYINYLKRFYES